MKEAIEQRLAELQQAEHEAETRLFIIRTVKRATDPTTNPTNGGVLWCLLANSTSKAAQVL